MSDELKECPFCGKAPLVQEIEPHKHNLKFGDFVMPDHPGCFTLECPTPNCCGMIADTRAELVAAWNRRTLAAPVASAAPSDEREKFEVWAKEVLPDLDQRREPGYPEEYACAQLHAAWHGWQGAIAHQPPKEALTEKAIDAIWESLPGLAIIKDKPQDQWNRLLRHEFAAAIIAASAPNKQLVVALRDILTWFGQYPELVPDETHYEKYLAAIDSGRAALAAAGEAAS